MIGNIGLISESDRRSYHNSSRHVYGNDVKYMMDEKKIGLWQIPRQISSYLIKLVSFGNINTLLEIGTCSGATTTVMAIYLQRFGLKAIDTVNIVNELPEGLTILWNRLNLPINTIIIGDINSKLQFQRYDTIFIDGDHRYEYVKKDYENYKNKTYLLAFHDINDIYSPGVRQLWDEIKQNKDNNNNNDDEIYEFTYHSHNDELMGIGLYHRNNHLKNFKSLLRQRKNISSSLLSSSSWF